MFTETEGKCIKNETCPRIQWSYDGALCHLPVCSSDLARFFDNYTCVPSCGDAWKYQEERETACREVCPSDAMYKFDGWCRKRCPVGSFAVPGNFTCEASTPSSLVWKQTPALPGVSFLERFPRSYSQINVSVEDEEEGYFAAFLEAPFSVASLRLLVAMNFSKASYVSALVWGGVVLGTEIQLTGKGEGTLLAERLSGDVMMVQCFLFVNLGKEKDGDIVTEKGDYQMQIRKSYVDLGTGIIAGYLT